MDAKLLRQCSLHLCWCVFKANDPRSGADLWTRKLISNGSYYGSPSTVSVINQRAYLIANSTLFAMDLANRTVLWSVPGTFAGNPATDGSAVYAQLGSS